MKQSFISIAILIIILVATVYFVSKAMRYTMRYKTEREKSAIMSIPSDRSHSIR